MNTPPDNDEFLTPAEQRLKEHMELIRATPPPKSGSLARSVVRSARIQRGIRRPLEVVGVIAGAILSGVAALLGIRQDRHQ